MDQYPPEHEWMKEKQIIFKWALFEISITPNLSSILESKEELISQGKGTLLEQLESVQSTIGMSLHKKIY